MIVARKLKTYTTNLGFFELALAAPSMMAALEAWGLGHNAFHQGFARQTDDPKIVAAAMAHPGVVLRRPVGTKGAFSENAKFPKHLWKIGPRQSPPNIPKAMVKARFKSVEGRKKIKEKRERADRAAIISFEKAKARRNREREKSDARESAREAEQRVQKARDIEKAQADLVRSQKRHEKVMAGIEKEREKLDRRADAEHEKWENERDALNAALRGAKEN